jgi:hypothetical protein
MSHILPLYTLAPLHSLDRLIYLVDRVVDVRQVHLMDLTLAHLTLTHIVELSTVHRTLQSSATAAGQFSPYIQLHRHSINLALP